MIDLNGPVAVTLSLTFVAMLLMQVELRGKQLHKAVQFSRLSGVFLVKLNRNLYIVA